MANIKKTDNAKCCKGMELMELPIWRWEGGMVLPLSQDVQWDLLKLITTCKAYEPAFLPRGIYLTAICTHVHENLYSCAPRT